MTSGPWQPLAEREVGISPSGTLHEGVPPHLEYPLREWIREGLAGGGASLVSVRLQIPIDFRDASEGVSTLTRRTKAGIELLTVIDAMLSLNGPWPIGDPVDLDVTGLQWKIGVMRNNLRRILDLGSSLYCVHPDGMSLVRREDLTAVAAYEEAVKSAQTKPDTGSAAEQIKIAWDSLHALQPDTWKAYSQAVFAVESAAHVLIEPNNRNATLGTMLGQMRNNPARYRLAMSGSTGSGDIAPLIAMTELLWKGQTRHGSKVRTSTPTLEETHMAVHLAVTLVHWFTSGAVQRNP